MSILLAEGHPTHRRFARQLFEQHFPDYGPVREVADGASAVQMAVTERPGLLMLDMDLPGVHGVDVARQIWAQAPDTKIIFWAEFADETCMRQTVRLIPPEKCECRPICAHGAGRPHRRAVYYRPRPPSRPRSCV
jgi:DNA-binding NarL/FixJ family response regulator